MRWYLSVAVIGVLAYGLFLVAHLPAAVVVPRLIPQGSGVTVAELEGSVWSGTARDVSVPPEARLSRVSWRLRPGGLLAGVAALDAQIEGEGLDLDGRLGWRLLAGELHLENVRLALDAAVLYRFGAVPFTLGGEIGGQVSRMSWKPGALPLIEGVATWRNAVVEMPAVPDLGEVGITASVEDDGSRIAWDGEPGAVATQGTLVLDPPAEYSLSMGLTPVEEPEPGLRSVLRLLGRPDADGSYRANLSGRVPGLVSPESG